MTKSAHKLSIIYPVMSLSRDIFVSKALKSYKKIVGIEQIIVTSDPDDLKQRSELLNIHYLETNCRAARLNLGLEKASGEWVLLHHPRSWLTEEGLKFLMSLDEKKQWGSFTHRFDKKSFGLEFTSWYSNKVRGDLSSIFYLDHCLFFKREALQQVFPFPEVDIFEDTEICLALKKVFGRGVRLPYYSTTSAVRFDKNGFFLQALKNQILKLQYYLNVDHRKMNKYYEKSIHLNAHYLDGKGDQH